MARIEGTEGNDTLNGTAENDQIFGLGGNDVLFGGPGNNDLFGGAGNDLLIGGPDFDYLQGGAGNDTIDGAGGNNEVAYDSSPGPVTVNLATGVATDGFGGIDTISNVGWIRGSAFADVLTGNAADNRFRPLAGADTVIGGEGIDWIRYDRDANYGGTAGVSVDLAAGTARDGFGDTDTLVSIERATGSNFNDTLFGSAADNFLEGLDGDDLLHGGAGFDGLNGGAGNDTVTYARDAAQGGTAGVLVDLPANFARDGFGQNDTLTGIENVIGTDFADTLIGDGGNNRLEGGGARDELIGLGGDDTLIGGPGDDYLEGGDGNDLIDSSADPAGGFGDFVRPGRGADTILGSRALWDAGDGIDIAYDDLAGIGGIRITVGANGSGTAVSGTPGLVNDTFTHAHYFLGSRDADSIRGSDEPEGSFRFEGFQGLQGNDTIDGGTNGFDQIDYRNEARGHASPRGVTVNLATGVATDTYGDTDTLRNIEGVEGTALADAMTAAANRPFIQFRGFQGNDTLTGAVGTRTRADYSRDAADGGGAGILADLAAGTIRDGFGDTDRVSLINDVRGTAQDDRISGDGADNWLDGGAGNDTLFGGAGNDELRDGAGNDQVFGGAGNDTIRAGSGEDTFDGGAGNDLLVLDVTGTAPDAFIIETNLATGTNGARGTTAGRDVLISIEAVEVIGTVRAALTGSAGNDSLTGGDGADTIDGGAGDDIIFGGRGEADLRDILFGGAGNDTIDGGHGNDEISGGDGHDSVLGGFGADRLIGNAGNDTLIGGALSDELNGGPGDDLLNGGFGFDRLNGGPGADRFFHLGIADHGMDWIQDYSRAEGDRLVFGGPVTATAADFLVQRASTPNAGRPDVAEAFVTYRPTAQVLWALIDGAAQPSLTVQVGSQVFDIL